MKREAILTKDAPSPIGPYSQGIEAEGSFIFTAGQIGLDPRTSQVVSGGIREQTKQAIENLTAILKAGRSDIAHVVKTTVFLKDMNEFGAMNEVYGQYFSSSPPSRSTVEVSRLPRDVRVEIEAIALVGR
jgi:2-iminobutanoate/2-iminopropanoate deaminase